MRPTRVFLDLDGVCNQFSSYALWYVLATDRMLPYSEYPAECQSWDIVNTANVLSAEEKHYTDKSFWDSLDRKFWSTIPPEKYLPWLLDCLCWCVGQDNIWIASTATLSPDCLAGKLDWIYEYMPKWAHRQYMFGRDKYLLANKTSLLIDDNQNNCEAFRAAQGSALLVPRPWNMLRKADPEQTIKESLRLIFQERVC